MKHGAIWRLPRSTVCKAVLHTPGNSDVNLTVPWSAWGHPFWIQKHLEAAPLHHAKTTGTFCKRTSAKWPRWYLGKWLWVDRNSDGNSFFNKMKGEGREWFRYSLENFTKLLFTYLNYLHLHFIYENLCLQNESIKANKMRTVWDRSLDCINKAWVRWHHWGNSDLYQLRIWPINQEQLFLCSDLCSPVIDCLGISPLL